jgi:hypothetical protein
MGAEICATLVVRFPPRGESEFSENSVIRVESEKFDGVIAPMVGALALNSERKPRRETAITTGIYNESKFLYIVILVYNIRNAYLGNKKVRSCASRLYRWESSRS